VKSVSEKFKSTRNRYNIWTLFKTKHTLRSSLMKDKLERDLQWTAQCIYYIPCECGRSYIGETGRPLAMRLSEHKHSLKEDFLEKSKLAQHAYEEGHRVGWKEARILETASSSRYRKCKELAHTV
jgi:predicted GIY-YIG superfamily endonuclease